jgi:hypothetical protein
MKITAVDAELHVFDEEVNWTQPIRLSLKFEDGSHLRLGHSGNGDRLVIDRLPLEKPLDMGEAGRTEIIDFTNRLDDRLRGVPSDALTAIKDAGQLIGFAVRYEAGELFCFWVHDDEFYWGSEATLKNDHWVEGHEPQLDGPLPL